MFRVILRDRDGNTIYKIAENLSYQGATNVAELAAAKGVVNFALVDLVVENQERVKNES